MSLDSLADSVTTLAVQIHHNVRGPRIDYVGLGLAAAASWAGLPGPGEAALITGGIAAANGKLDIFAVVAVAWLGALVGGAAGWLVGLKAGRAVVTARGPFRRGRLHGLERGERFYRRFGAVAVLFTPSWVAGINKMRTGRFLAANALSGLVWALGFGVGAYYAGPPIEDLVTDLGVASGVVVAALLASTVGGVWLTRRRRAAR
jgi:membrane protein DedA with SNARE-associated domain